jgi:hypothetical protein
MTKRSGSYRSILRGVSQQPPEQRMPGQHGEQVNMLSDPVAGVTRRQGTTRVYADELAEMSFTDPADLAVNYETAQLKVLDREYTAHFRRPGTGGTTQPVVMVRRGEHEWFGGTPADGSLAGVTLSAAAAAILGAGVTAHAVVGEYLLLAHTTPVVSTRTSLLEDNLNRYKLLVQVRGGAYSRKYTIKLKLVGQTAIVAEYTTPAATYGGTLDTSGIAASDPEYTKKVNDLVNAYNSAVTAYIGTAAAAIQPQAIAQSLAVALLAAGGTAQGVGAAAEFGVIRVQAPGAVEFLEVFDGGDSSLLKGTWQEVPAASDLPPYAFTGKVVRVSPRDGDDFYMEATSDLGAWVFGQVVWKECTDTRVALSNMFCVGIEHDGWWYIGSGPADLDALLDSVFTVRDVPTYGVRRAGDDDSNPEPHFVGRVITYLGVFQDRLLIGSDNVINASLVGGYFSFFRTTVLSVPDDDPVEMFATGTEGDVLRRGVVFDKSLILFGDLAQYAIPGTVPLTPSTSFIMQSSRHLAATVLPPVAIGNLVFYAKAGIGKASVHQINVGNVDDTSNSSEISVQLDDYLHGAPAGLVGLSSPECLVLHLRERPHELFVFRYIDTADGQRQLDSWHRWEFSAACGVIMGISNFRDKLRVHFIRDDELVVDEVSLAVGDNAVPHLDSIGFAEDRLLDSDAADVYVAWGADAAASRRWQGNRAPTADALQAELGEEPDTLYAGIPFDSYFTPTPPVLRDQNDAPITNGTLMIDSLVATFRDTVGLTADVHTDWEDYESARYIGLTTDAAGSLVGRRSLQRGTEVLPVGQSTQDYALTIRSIDWLPLSVTSLDWVGQYFNRTRRS